MARAHCSSPISSVSGRPTSSPAARPSTSAAFRLTVSTTASSSRAATSAPYDWTPPSRWIGSRTHCERSNSWLTPASAATALGVSQPRTSSDTVCSPSSGVGPSYHPGPW